MEFHCLKTDLQVVTSVLNNSKKLVKLSRISLKIRVVETNYLDRDTDRPGPTVLTQIRLILEKQSDQGLHCLLFGNTYNIEGGFSYINVGLRP